MAQNILKKFHPSAKLLDDMIFKLETNLGRQHTVSPFTQLYQKYNYSTTSNVAPAKVEAPPAKKEEEVKAASPVAPPEAPKEEKKKEPKAPKEPKPAAVSDKQPKGGKKPEEGPKLDEVWEVYSKYDVRVGKIIECGPQPESEKLYIEKIDLGEPEGPRTILSGLNGKIPIDEMLSGLVIVFANLKPRPLAGTMSNGMVMCASNEDHSVVELVRPPEGSKPGDRIQLSGNPILGQPVTEDRQEILNPKKKYAERFLEKLLTNDNCEATYNGVTLTTSAGILKSKSLKNVHIA
jgi:aminoacyl tRNA synthase complex-interacting multifunctional protein 1